MAAARASKPAPAGVDLTCPVCYDTFTAPRFLPCHHTLCTECIADLMERARTAGAEHFSCPMCQTRVPVPDEGEQSFQVNYYLGPMLADKAKVVPKTAKDTALEAERHRSEIRRQLLSLTTFQGALADLQDEGVQRGVVLDASCQDVVKIMETSREKAFQMIASRIHKTEASIHKLKGRISKVVEEDKKNINEKMSTLSALLDEANTVLAAGDAEFLNKKDKFMAKIQTAMSKVPQTRGVLKFTFKTSSDIESLLLREGTFGYVTVQFQYPFLRHRFSLSSSKQQRKLKKLCPRPDGKIWASVGNFLVEISEDFVETKRLEFPAEIVDFVPGPDGNVYIALPFPHSVKVLHPSETASDFVSPLNPPSAMTITDKQELVFAANDGKELSLAFYTLNGARTKRITIPMPDFTPTSMALTKRGQIFLCSTGPAEVLCLDADFSELAVLREDGGFKPCSISSLRGMGSGVGDILVANGSKTWRNVEMIHLKGSQLSRTPGLIQWEREQGVATDDEDAHMGRTGRPGDGNLARKVSCAAVDRTGRLWVGEEGGHVTVYDWLMRVA